MYKYGIVVIGYKNAEGIRRLLSALSMAEYDNRLVKLIISIDKSDSNDVKAVADAFEWKHGEKYVITFAERLGLRDHVMHCGDYLNIYDLDALAVFEDDMMPSRDYFQFTEAVTEKYIGNKNIAGVSLYTNCTNFSVGEKFIPVRNDGDNFFIQSAQSRGQIWFREQWNDFREWYNAQVDFEDDFLLPKRVTSWPETSWKKYHIKYCVVKNKYFVYPYTSFSTCFGDIGEHIRQQRNDIQVPLSNAGLKSYHLIDFDDKALKYDVFFENQGLYQYCNVEKEDLLVDLYGDHIMTDKKYILTKKKLPCHIIKSWGNRLVPHEMNLIYDIPGNDIFLYDANSSKMLKLPERVVCKSKMERYFDILEKWMTLEEQGGKIEECFLRNQWEHVAIYGYGKIGRHLRTRLHNTSVKIDYIIDQNENIDGEGIEIRKLDDGLPSVDAIVVTPILEFETIREALQNRAHTDQVVSMEDLFST